MFSGLKRRLWDPGYVSGGLTLAACLALHMYMDPNEANCSLRFKVGLSIWAGIAGYVGHNCSSWFQTDARVIEVFNPHLVRSMN